jgi:Glycosyltransferase WbsX
MLSTNKLISLAYYLPQFHEIEENNRWWGQGFTEWTQVNQAKKYFNWQVIRKPIAPFGEYSLLNPDVMEWQSSVAKQHCIDGFLVFDYWFGKGKTLLEKPMQMVLDKQLNFDYCLCWANHTWYNKRENITLQEQQYLGAADYTAYFNRLLPHFQSSHYIKIDNKPIFAIFNPNEISDLSVFIDIFQSLAVRHGFDGLYLIADNTDASSQHAAYFDAYTRSNSLFKARNRDNPLSYIKEKLTRKLGFTQLGPFCYSYQQLVVKNYIDSQDVKYMSSVFTGWDTTPRHLKRGTTLKDFDVATFKRHLAAIKQTLVKRDLSNKIIIIKSWNEWAEGNLLEPDSVFGYQLLEAYRDFIKQYQQ